MQESWQQCRTAGYALDEVNEVLSIFPEREFTRLEELSLPVAATLKASTSKYALAILPTESGGFGYYIYGDDDGDGEGGNKSVSVPSLVAQQARLVSNHIRYSDVNSDKYDSFADTEMVDKDFTDPVTKDPSGSQPPMSTGNVLRDLILRSNVDRKQAMELDRLVAKLPTRKLLTAEWDQLQDLITEHAASTSHALELMEFARKQENSSFAPITDLDNHAGSSQAAAIRNRFSSRGGGRFHPYGRGQGRGRFNGQGRGRGRFNGSAPQPNNTGGRNLNNNSGGGQNYNYAGQHNFGGRGNGGPPKTKLVPGLSGLTSGIQFCRTCELLATCLEQTAPTTTHAVSEGQSQGNMLSDS